MNKITEKTAKKANGFFMLFALIALIILEIFLLATGIRTEDSNIFLIFFPLLIILFLVSSGFTVIQPNDSRV